MSSGLRTRANTDPATAPSRWRVVLRGATVVFGVLHLVAAAVLWDLEAAGLTLLLACVLAVRGRLPRTSTVALGALFANMVAWTLVGTLRNLGGGAGAPAVFLQAALAAAGLVGLVALVADRRGAHGGVGPRVVPVLGVLGVLAATVMALLGAGPQGPRPGDLEVVAADNAFTPQQLEAAPGQISVHFRNGDFFWHTFSIPSLDVHLWVPVDGSGRVTFDAPAGTWAYTCEVPGHGLTMRGELVVEP